MCSLALSRSFTFSLSHSLSHFSLLTPMSILFCVIKQWRYSSSQDTVSLLHGVFCYLYHHVAFMLYHLCSGVLGYQKQPVHVAFRTVGTRNNKNVYPFPPQKWWALQPFWLQCRGPESSQDLSKDIFLIYKGKTPETITTVTIYISNLL